MRRASSIACGISACTVTFSLYVNDIPSIVHSPIYFLLMIPRFIDPPNAGRITYSFNVILIIQSAKVGIKSCRIYIPGIAALVSLLFVVKVDPYCLFKIHDINYVIILLFK